MGKIFCEWKACWYPHAYYVTIVGVISHLMCIGGAKTTAQRWHSYTDNTGACFYQEWITVYLHK